MFCLSRRPGGLRGSPVSTNALRTDVSRPGDGAAAGAYPGEGVLAEAAGGCAGDSRGGERLRASLPRAWE
eukprot:5394994-Pyramimonas_sp.AAC.1